MSNSQEVLVPDIGDYKEVDVIEVHVKAGDEIKKDDSLIALETDKATMDIPSPAEGVVKEIKVTPGDKVSKDSIILIIDTPSSKKSKKKTEKKDKKDKKTETKTSSQTVYLPDVGTDDAISIIEVHVREGDTIEEEQTLITLESDKASMDVPSPTSGKVSKLLVKLNDKIKQGDAILEILSSASSDAPTINNLKEEVEETKAENKKEKISSGEIHSSPIVRRMANEFDIDLSQIQGTGRKNRITREDLQRYVKSRMNSSGPGLNIADAPKVDYASFGEIEVQPLKRIKKISGAALARNWVTIPHVTQFDEADITELEKFRQENKKQVEKQGIKLTPLVFIMKAVVSCLQKFPNFNSSLNPDTDELVLKKYFHIGVAVDTPNGLVVPVVRDVDKKGLIDLAKELGTISQKARDGQLTAKDMQGGCFTISSLGGIGGTAFTPIVNLPEVAILGVSKSQIKPVYLEKEFKPRLMLPISLSYDHRVIDGAEAVKFTSALVQHLSDIRCILL